MNSSKTVKPTLIIILSRFPYPLEKGDKLRAFNQIVGLSVKYKIHLICITDTKLNNSDIEVLQKYCQDIHIFKLNKIIQLINLLLCFFTEKPFQISYFWQYHIHRKINKLLKKINPDFIYAQLIRTTEYVKNYHSCPKILDYMDVFSMGIERRIKTQPWYLKTLFQQEYVRLKNYERHIYDYFEEHLIISEQDRSYIIHPKSNEISIVKNGIAPDFFIEKTMNKKYELVFIGNMSYPPNIAASEYIIKELMPEFNNKYSLLISGVNPTKSLLKYQSNKIHISGWIKDIRESYLQSKIFVAPMFLGTGLQNKLLEAMAIGIPCITTTMANKALEAIPNESILIADNKEEFINQIILLLTNEDFYEKIKIGGKNFVKTNFSWDSSNEQLSELIVKSRNKLMN